MKSAMSRELARKFMFYVNLSACGLTNQRIGKQLKMDSEGDDVGVIENQAPEVNSDDTTSYPKH